MTTPLAVLLLSLAAGENTRIEVNAGAQVPERVQKALDVARQQQDAALDLLSRAKVRGDLATTPEGRAEAAADQREAAEAARKAAEAYQEEERRRGADFDEADRAAENLGDAMARELRKAFPCATVQTDREVRAVGNLARQAEALGIGGGAEALAQFRGTPEYLVTVTTAGLGPTAKGATGFTAALVGLGPEGTVARGQVRIDVAGALAPGDRGLEEFLDQLRDAELCPWVGTVTVELEVKRKQVTASAAPVACNGLTGKHVEERRVTERKKVTWEFEKQRRRWTGGVVSGTKEGSSVHEVTDDCFPCDPRTQGRQTITRVKREQTEIRGRAHPRDQAMGLVKVLFQGDQYAVFVKAATREALRRGFDSRRSVGKCESTMRDDPPTEGLVVDELVFPFGPFDGKKSDERLLVSERKFVDYDASRQEETTYTFSADLSRKGR